MDRRVLSVPSDETRFDGTHDLASPPDGIEYHSHALTAPDRLTKVGLSDEETSDGRSYVVVAHAGSGMVGGCLIGNAARGHRSSDDRRVERLVLGCEPTEAANLDLGGRGPDPDGSGDEQPRVPVAQADEVETQSMGNLPTLDGRRLAAGWHLYVRSDGTMHEPAMERQDEPPSRDSIEQPCCHALSRRSAWITGKGSVEVEHIGGMSTTSGPKRCWVRHGNEQNGSSWRVDPEPLVCALDRADAFDFVAVHTCHNGDCRFRVLAAMHDRDHSVRTDRCRGSRDAENVAAGHEFMWRWHAFDSASCRQRARSFCPTIDWYDSSYG